MLTHLKIDTMNRDIKFRGKRKENGQWCYGYYYYNSEDDLHCIWTNSDNGQPVDYARIVDPKTVGQYTGLKDKNGKEIYEGDKMDEWNKQGVVRWDSKNAGFILDCGDLVYGIGVLDWELTEIIGNIHDNPELIQ